ncbi:hypothetical protein SASPL_130483 [Salvia splendens]|uniref:Replication factor A C-terminal domain-containing protein n=1 Tax=Salvia splendens TaxID=180675 RepID=A0A8X8ZJH4_SALSN|nr:hypothetical protein SASPL_130483 [Salvia splendens]
MNVKTEMVEVNDLRFLREMFDFKPFAEISQYENVDDSSFFDVIGVITGPGRVISQSKYRLIEIEICDENVYVLGEIRISTHFQASKVVINADVKEVKDFRMRIKDDSSFVQQISVIEGGQRLGGEFDDLQVKSLEDLSCLEEGSCWVFGKIESVECHYGEWYFLACKTCVKKVREVDNKFNCSGCTKTHTYAVKRFKFVVNVVDHTSNASLLLWDREGSQLLGRNVTDFLGNGGQVAPKNSIPALIEEILVSRKSYVTTDLSTLANENISKLLVEGAEFNSVVDAAEGSQKVFVTPDLSAISNDTNHGWGVEGSVKRCLDLEFDKCDHGDEVQIKKKEKIDGSY